YSLVELTDGSILAATSVLIKKRKVELTLLNGGNTSFPLQSLGNFLVRADEQKSRFECKERLLNTNGRAAYVASKDGVPSNIDCTFEAGTEDGKQIVVAVDIAGEVVVTKRNLGRMPGKKDEEHGFIFKHTLGPKALAPVCKLFNAVGDTIYVSDILPG